MNASATSRTATQAQHSQPATVEELLDREEALAIQQLTRSVQQLGEDAQAALDLRRRIRSHPLLSAGIAAAAGFVAGPFLPRALRGLAGTSSFVSKTAAGSPRLVPGLVRAALDAARARR